ncbi:MAG: LPS assembly lipoprotein LptE [Kangiellaceae bacterium]
MKISVLRLFLVFIIGAQFIAGCGFHLRGQGESYSVAQLNGIQVYLAVTSEDSLLRRQIANDLQASGIVVVNSPELTENHLVILNSKVLRRAIGVDSNGRNNEFELNQNVRFLVSHIDVKQQRKTSDKKKPKTSSLDEVMNVEARRSFYLDNIDLIGKRAEEKALLDSIRQEVSRKIISRFVVAIDRQIKNESES